MATIEMIKPKAPITDGWIELDVSFSLGEGSVMSAWVLPQEDIMVLSAVEKAHWGDEPVGPEYHLSITRQGRRCDLPTARNVLRQFDLADAKEQTHVDLPIARHFWHPVKPQGQLNQ